MEISKELCVFRENYTMSRLVAVEAMKYYHGKLTNVCGALYSQNKELLAVCKEVLQQMKKGNVSGTNKEMSTRRGKAKVLVECSISCLTSTQTPKCSGFIPFLLMYVSSYPMFT